MEQLVGAIVQLEAIEQRVIRGILVAAVRGALESRRARAVSTVEAVENAIAAPLGRPLQAGERRSILAVGEIRAAVWVPN